MPQMIQRRFSKDRKRITVWDIQRERLYENVSIKGQFQKKYFYERTKGGIEEALSRIEGKTKNLFDEIEKSEKLPNQGSEDWKHLVLWLVMQVQRTDELAVPINQFSREILLKILGSLKAEGQIPEGPGGISVEDLDVEIDPRWGRQWSVALAHKTAGGALDLEAVLLQSRDGRIILPDCGAIRFNLIAEEGKGPWGWASIGSGALLPLSNKNVVVFYDPGAYTWMGNREEKLKVMDEAEQIMFAKTCFLRSSNLVAFNTDSDWVKKVAADLHTNRSESKPSAITIPGLIPRPVLMNLAKNAECSLYGLPSRLGDHILPQQDSCNRF